MALIKLNNQSLTAVTSAGLPSGTVLQETTWRISAANVTTNGSWNGTVTPTFANTYGVETHTFTKTKASSKVLCLANGHVDHIGNPSGASVVALLGHNNSLIGCAYQYVRYANDEPYAYSFSGEDTSSATTDITFRLVCHSGFTSMCFSRTTSNTSGLNPFTVVLQEIAA